MLSYRVAQIIIPHRTKMQFPDNRVRFYTHIYCYIIIIIINDSIYPAVSKASRTGNKVSCQPNDCPNR